MSLRLWPILPLTTQTRSKPRRARDLAFTAVKRASFLIFVFCGSSLEIVNIRALCYESFFDFTIKNSFFGPIPAWAPYWLWPRPDFCPILASAPSCHIRKGFGPIQASATAVLDFSPAPFKSIPRWYRRENVAWRLDGTSSPFLGRVAGRLQVRPEESWSLLRRLVPGSIWVGSLN